MKGTVLRLHEGAWSALPQPSTGDVFSIGGAGKDVWAGGADGTFHWDGAGWTRESDMRPLAFAATSGRLTAMALGEFFERKDGKWTSLYATPDHAFAFGAAMGPSGDAWAVGERGRVFHHDASGWQMIAPDAAWWSAADPTASVDGIYAALGHVWAVGFNLESPLLGWICLAA